MPLVRPGRPLAPVLATAVGGAVFQAGAAAPLAVTTRRLPMPILQPPDLIQADGVCLEARIADSHEFG